MVPQARGSSYLLGRRDELAACDRAYASGARLIVLTGIGGIGKSTLANAFAERPGVFGNVFRVTLEECRSVDDMVDGLALALGVELRPSLSGRVARAAAALRRHSQPLILFDAFETIVEEGPVILSMLLDAVLDLRILVTCRCSVSLAEATEVRVGPLREEVGAQADPGVALFHRSCPIPLMKDGRTERSILRVVQAVDRIPLAIEFAAARAAIMPLTQLAIRVGLELRLQGQPGRGSLSRHQTMHQIIAWSWGTLGDAARHALAQLAIFRGPFNSTDAEHIVNVDGTLDAVQELIQASLLYLHNPKGRRGPEYRLLAPVREFGRAKLIELGEFEATQDRHTRWFLDGIEPDDDVWTRWRDALHVLVADRWAEFDRVMEYAVNPVDRLRAMIRRFSATNRRSTSLRNRRPLERAICAVEADLTPDAQRPRALDVGQLLMATYSYSLMDESQLARSLARIEPRSDDLDPALRSSYHYLCGTLHELRGEEEDARQAFRLAYEIASSDQEPFRWSMAAIQWACFLDPDDPRIPELRDEALTQVAQCDSKGTHWFVAIRAADLLRNTPHLQERSGLISHAFETAAEAGILHVSAFNLICCALFEYQQGDIAKALQLSQEAFELAEHDHPSLAGKAHFCTGMFHHHIQDYAEARKQYRLAIAKIPRCTLASVAQMTYDLLCAESQGENPTRPQQLLPGTYGQILDAWFTAAMGQGAFRLDEGFTPTDPLAISMALLARVVTDRRYISADTLYLAPEGLRPPRGEWISTTRRRVLRKLIDTLVEARLRRAGQSLSQVEIVTRVWPQEQRPSSASARNRMHVLLNKARRLGLTDFLETTVEGWRLSPELRVILAEHT